MKEYKFKINGNAYKVTIDKVENGVADVSVNGTDYKVELEDNGGGKAEEEPGRSARHLSGETCPTGGVGSRSSSFRAGFRRGIPAQEPSSRSDTRR